MLKKLLMRALAPLVKTTCRDYYLEQYGRAIHDCQIEKVQYNLAQHELEISALAVELARKDIELDTLHQVLSALVLDSVKGDKKQ